MVFYLANWITKPVGDFMLAACEECGNDVFTLLIKRRRWVSFLSLPLIPTSQPEWYHQCPECNAAWELPDGCGEDVMTVSEKASALIRGRINADEYHATLETFVDEHGQVEYDDALAASDPEPVNPAYIQ